MTTDDDIWKKTSRQGTTFHKDNGYGYSACGVGALRGREWDHKIHDDTRLCLRCIEWLKKRGRWPRG